MISGIYLGWTGFDNLGDEAMFWVCKNRFSDVHWATYNRIANVLHPRSFADKVFDNPTHLAHTIADEICSGRRLRALATRFIWKIVSVADKEVAMLGGGTIMSPDYLDLYRSIRAQVKTAIPVFGAGVQNPSFWTGKPNWTDCRKAWADALSELPVVGVRGPLSKDLLEEAGAKNVVVSGDAAVLIHKHCSVKALRTLGWPLRVGVNCGTARYFDGDVEAVETELATVARELSSRGHTVELIAICPGDLPSCYRVAQASGLDSSTVQPVLSEPKAYLAKLTTLDFLVGLKLHAAVLAAASNIPFFMLAYQPKCFDFALSIGWERFTVSTRDLARGAAWERVDSMMAQISELRTELSLSMGRLSDTFDQYCDRVNGLLNLG